jgi:hypothetical protein
MTHYLSSRSRDHTQHLPPCTDACVCVCVCVRIQSSGDVIYFYLLIYSLFSSHPSPCLIFPFAEQSLHLRNTHAR